MHSSSGVKTYMKINSVDPTSTKPPERSGKTIGNNYQDKESTEEEKKKKVLAAYMPKPPYLQRLKAENKNKAPKKEPKEEKGATDDSVKFQQIQKVPTMHYLPTIMGSNNKTYMITEGTSKVSKFGVGQVVPRFKTLYHEAHFNATLSTRRILPKLIIQADENVFNPIRFQIYQRKWEKFTKLIQAIGHLMVKEFYANAWEPDKAKRKPYTYTSMVRGTDVSFAPSNIKRVLKLRKDPIPDAPSYHERKANKDFRLDHVLEDMCEEGADWVHHKDGRPHFLRRSDLEPMSKGWYEFICRSIFPTTNRSKLTVERAVLIHSIIIGENINVEVIIAEQIYKFVYKMDTASSLPFPSIIAALCADARISAIPDDTLIPQEPPIIGEAMTRTREARARNPMQARQATPPQQQPPQDQQQPQFQHQQDFSDFYTHFDTSMS
ncbi:hypothetical protein PIB30_079608 [Stylosanthes scabra]|uniref:Putative plant transposon protein domain-containing protein n=1 Tax=Stylosanthes scabra TaxID=79078 RepID=A0ABU6STC8_9FABA|nr:hypothetical protein [Stylosanthes scabra]